MGQGPWVGMGGERNFPLDLLFYKAWLEVNILIFRLEFWRCYFYLIKICNEGALLPVNHLFSSHYSIEHGLKVPF